MHYHHPYLSDYECFERLMAEYDKHKGLIVAFDFDNCVHDYHKQGHNYVEVIELIRAAKEIGCYLIVFTAEEDIDKVITFLNDNKIPFDTLNENPPFWKSTARKIYYNILLDDRAGLLSAYTQLKWVIDKVKARRAKELEEQNKKEVI